MKLRSLETINASNFLARVHGYPGPKANYICILSVLSTLLMFAVAYYSASTIFTIGALIGLSSLLLGFGLFWKSRISQYSWLLGVEERGLYIVLDNMNAWGCENDRPVAYFEWDDIESVQACMEEWKTLDARGRAQKLHREFLEFRIVPDLRSLIELVNHRNTAAEVLIRGQLLQFNIENPNRKLLDVAELIASRGVRWVPFHSATVNDIEFERCGGAWTQADDKIRALLYRGFRTEAMLYAAKAHGISWSEALRLLDRLETDIVSGDWSPSN